MAFQQANELYKAFEIAYDAKDYETSKGYINRLKIKLIELPALPPMFEYSPTQKEELLLARSVYEHAVILGIIRQDDSDLDRNFSLLFSFYEDTKRRGVLETSPQESVLQGLFLLELLVQNRIAEFHSELERMPKASFSDDGVQLALSLERSLVEGAYNRVLADAAAATKGSLQHKVAARLYDTVRREVADCAQTSYESLTLADATKVLMLSSEAETLRTIEEREWDYNAETKVISFSKKTKTAVSEGDSNLSALQIIGNTLLYAKELERIV
uniref:CSN8/PSMD8/EIF3K domain-containing protein n=1 Tax=Polytomella parva TaxID=51329 RepID=A0A6U0XYY1_9CHLO